MEASLRGRVALNFVKKHGEGSVNRFLFDVNRVVSHQATWDDLSKRWRTSKPVLWRTAHALFDFIVIPKQSTVEALDDHYHLHSFIQGDRQKHLKELNEQRTSNLRLLTREPDSGTAV